MQPFRTSAPTSVDRTGKIRVRPVDRADADGLVDFYARLSPESRHGRFLGTCSGLAAEASRYFCGPDHEHAEGLVAILDVAGPDEGRIVGHVCLVPNDTDGLELGIAVADEFQGQGIGRRLFTEAFDWIRRHGVHKLVATCFADNARVLSLLTSAPNGATIRRGQAGVVEVEIPLGPPPEEGADR